MKRVSRWAPLALPLALVLALTSFAVELPATTKAPATEAKLDFNRDIRPILSNNCYACHGPDDKVRKGGLRLDTREGAIENAGVVPGKPEASSIIARIKSTDDGESMPPPKTGKKLSPKEVETLERWIKQGAPFAKHWSYVPPVRPPVPTHTGPAWGTNPIDAFIRARLTQEGLTPQPEADRYTLIRRASLDLTGLPPTLAEVDAFIKDKSPNAYEAMIDRLLAKPSFGEHWARMWLDLARYADSAGYADDPPRTIWAYRDYVIKSFNANKRFDQFTIEQIAGDLLPNPTDEQLIATAFHRNTLTNNEGGTNDEEFRNVAIVDRVNTTLAVWMGTSMACAQCHTHKYDPISQAEYFRFFAFLNNTADADRGDESPTLPLFTDEQRKQKAVDEKELIALQEKLKNPPAAVLAGQAAWEKAFPLSVKWVTPKPRVAKIASGSPFTVQESQSILLKNAGKTDTYTIELPLTESLAALRIEALPHDSLPSKSAGHAGNFVITQVKAQVVPTDVKVPSGRYVRVSIPGPKKILALAEVQVFSQGGNIAPKGKATQSSIGYGGEAKRAIDGNTDGDYFKSNSVTHNADNESDPWWEVDLGNTAPVDRIVLWNRTDGGSGARLTDFRIQLLDDKRKTVWEQNVKPAPNPSTTFALSTAKPIRFVDTVADYQQASFDAKSVIDPAASKQKGWAVGGSPNKPHTLTLIPEQPIAPTPGSLLVVTIEQNSVNPNHTLGHFRLGYSSDAKALEQARTPTEILTLLRKPADQRTADEAKQVTAYYVSVAPALTADRQRIAALQKMLAELKPSTTVPIYRELPAGQRRTTKIQIRGNFMDTGDAVTEGVPSAFHKLPAGSPVDRLAMAKWLVSPENPLTPRVMANRFWEQIFGTGLVRTSEEFGAQGELPSHPELLDWLAAEYRDSGWDTKAFLKKLVMSSTYRQSGKVTPAALEKDPDNRLLSRGPRFRLPAETVRDQALAISGLLSGKMYGPSVKPPQPTFGLSAAFGRTLDWQTSAGEDKFRRGLYTEWRRTNPYPSMTTFDAPSRESCTLRRVRTNTPLQALVTLNDPVYIEAAQALARRIAEQPGTPAEKAAYGFRLAVSRPPSEKEQARLVALFDEAKQKFTKDTASATKMATDPIGPLPKGANVADLAAWTVVGNVLLNLDEVLMRR